MPSGIQFTIINLRVPVYFISEWSVTQKGPLGVGNTPLGKILKGCPAMEHSCQGIWKGPQEATLSGGGGYGKLEAGKWKQGVEGLAEKRG